MKPSPKNNREKLNFSYLAKETFNFLQNYGYVVTYGDDTIVQFAGQLGSINVYHGRSSYEIGIELGPGNDGKSKMFSLSLLIQLVSGEESKKYFNPSATTADSVHRFLFDQATLLKKYGGRVFDGDLSVWADLEEIRKRNALNMEIESKLENSKSLADKAFKAHRFRDVVKYLSEVEAWLTPAEKKKLAYARGHLEA